MIVIGLTGSIGMGKSTLAAMLQKQGVPVHDADAEVHNLLGPRGAGYAAVAAGFPFFSYPQIYLRRKGGYALDREALGKIIFGSDREREKLEKILHPLVRAAQKQFIVHCKRLGQKIVALDIPLLFETGGENFVDVTAVASAPYEVQRARVLERAGMTEEKFHVILNRQMPDAEKCARADYVIRTGLGRAHSMRDIKAMLRDIKNKKK